MGCRRKTAITALELFDGQVRGLPPSERLRLAASILDDLANSQAALLDSGAAWTEQDAHELKAYSLACAASSYPEAEELV
jgi:hypothetical protein